MSLISAATKGGYLGCKGVEMAANPKPKTEAVRDEFRRFEDLARKLLHVPKHELDEKRKPKS
jgi:hypothetical protein